jgi:hypothetical protein
MARWRGVRIRTCIYRCLLFLRQADNKVVASNHSIYTCLLRATRSRVSVHASHEALILRSSVAHPGSPWLTLLARCERLRRHGVGEREGELGADFSSLELPISENVLTSYRTCLPRGALIVTGVRRSF